MCTFLDAGKILLYNILGRYQSDAVSKQILRGQFPGGLGSGLRHQVGRFECKSRHGVFGHGSPTLPATKSPSATTVEGVRAWTRSLRPPRDHAETSLTVGRARPERNYRVRTMRSCVWASRATEGIFVHYGVLLPLPLCYHAPRARDFVLQGG